MNPSWSVFLRDYLLRVQSCHDIWGRFERRRSNTWAVAVVHSLYCDSISSMLLLASDHCPTPPAHRSPLFLVAAPAVHASSFGAYQIFHISLEKVSRITLLWIIQLVWLVRLVEFPPWILGARTQAREGGGDAPNIILVTRHADMQSGVCSVTSARWHHDVIYFVWLCMNDILEAKSKDRFSFFTFCLTRLLIAYNV